MPSSRPSPTDRRKVFLNLSGQIEGQLRAAYDCRFRAGKITQAGLAKLLGVNRSVIHRRLTGQTNMTEETIADMVWGLDYAIEVKIFDPATAQDHNHFFTSKDEADFLSTNAPKQAVPPPSTEAPKNEMPQLPQQLKDISIRIGTS